MSKKNYKKRKQAPHTKAKMPRNVKKESKLEKFLDNWMWLITLVVICAIAACLVIFIPKCDEAGTCDSCGSSCSKVEDESEDIEDGAEDDVASAADVVTSAADAATDLKVKTLDNISEYTDQFDAPKPGEEVAVFETTLGTIKMRLFENAAPKTVANFKGLIGEGYYDGVSFHRVMSNFMIQGGDPTGSGSGGKTFDGNVLPDEFNNGYYNFRGALSMANTGDPNSGSSQFFIVQNSDITDGGTKSVTADYLVQLGEPQWVADQYALGGGYYVGDHQLQIDYLGHTVFGQAYEGLAVIDAISMLETDNNDRPLTDVIINRAYLETVA